MFDKKYKKVMELLDNEIELAFMKHNVSLEDTSKSKTDKEISDNFMLRSGKWNIVDKRFAALEALCELKRKIEKEIGK
jgi:hypothetical protein